MSFRALATRASLFAGLALIGTSLSCSSSGSPAAAGDGGSCFPDNDGINGGSYTEDLVVNDTGFFFSGPDAGPRAVIQTQNDALVTLTLTNTGTTRHGFQVQCTSVTPTYPNVPAGCSSMACFPADSTIQPLDPGKSATIMFDTPTPDGLSYPIVSSEPTDSTVPGLNGSLGTAWSLD